MGGVSAQLRWVWWAWPSNWLGQRLTLGTLALPAHPQAEQGGALVQQRVGVLNTDPVDVIHTEVQLAGQFCGRR